MQVTKLQDLAMVCFACRKYIVIFLCVLLRLQFSGNIPRIHSFGHNACVASVTCKRKLRISVLKVWIKGAVPETVKESTFCSTFNTYVRDIGVKFI